MFKAFKKQKNNQQKKHPQKDDDCLMCHVSPEIIKSLKDDKQEKSKKS